MRMQEMAADSATGTALVRVEFGPGRHTAMSMRHSLKVARLIVGRNLATYLRGQFLTGVSVAVLATIAFWLLGLRWAIVWGPLAGAMSIVPIYGLAFAILVAVVAGTLQAPDDARLALSAAAALVAIQVVDNLVVGPRVQARSLGFRPLASLAIVVAGGIVLAPLLGPFAPLFALPAMAMLRDALRYRDLRRALPPEAALHALRDAVPPPGEREEGPQGRG